MKPVEVRRLATDHTLAELREAAEALAEDRDPPFPIEGADSGERLTHVLLAQRVREHLDSGEDLRDAFRAVMASVRAVLTNE
jgi:hypothetical protein